MSDKQSAEEWLESKYPCAHETPICSNPLCVNGYVKSDLRFECLVCGGPIYRRDCPKCRKQALDMRAAEERERVKGIVWDEIECICAKCDGKCPRCTAFDRIAKEAPGITTVRGKITIVIAEDDGRYHAYTPDLKGLHVDGATRQEALINAEDAIDVYLASIAKAEGGESERIKMGALKDKLPPGNLPRMLSVPIDEDEEETGGEG